LGLATNFHGLNEVQAALDAERISFDLWETERPGHATALAERAVLEGRELVIAAGGDGTIHEVARGLVNTDVVLALMPLGSVMNLARTLWIPHNPQGAAQAIGAGRVLAVDLGRVGRHIFLEAAGVGVVAGLFSYFNKLDSSHPDLKVVAAALRFIRQVGTADALLEFDGGTLGAKTQAVSVANAPYVGAAFAVAPRARMDDGLLDVTVFDHTKLPRLLLYLALTAGGRPEPAPPHTQMLRTRWLRVAVGDGERPLPVHADGDPSGTTPATFGVATAALRVIVGTPADRGIRAWAPPPS
jgi:diacylglycerol kinase (ATP)